MTEDVEQHARQIIETAACEVNYIFDLLRQGCQMEARESIQAWREQLAQNNGKGASKTTLSMLTGLNIIPDLYEGEIICDPETFDFHTALEEVKRHVI